MIQKDFAVKLFDPMAISAKEIIKYIEEKEKAEFVTVEYTLKRPVIQSNIGVFEQ